MPNADAGPEGARLRLIGGFRVVAADGTPVAIANRRGRGLLAFLHLEPDHAVSRERLCGLLWSDRGETQARASLRQCLLELREALGEAGLDFLDVGREQISLRAGAMASDTDDLARALGGDGDEALAACLTTMGGGRLLDHRGQRLLRQPSGFHKAGEAGALAQRPRHHRQRLG